MGTPSENGSSHVRAVVSDPTAKRLAALAKSRGRSQQRHNGLWLEFSVELLEQLQPREQALLDLAMSKPGEALRCLIELCDLVRARLKHKVLPRDTGSQGRPSTQTPRRAKK